MRTKLTGVVIAGAATIALAASPAASAPPAGLSSYAAGGSSVSLDLEVPLLGLEVTAASTSAGVSSDGPAAAADGQSLATPLFSTDTAPSATPGGDPSAHVCAIESELDLPDPLDLADPDLACVDTSAVLSGGSPVATSETSEILLRVGGAGITQQVLDPILGAGLEDAISEILGAAEILVDVDEVVAAILGQLVDPEGTLLTVSVAPNESDASASAEAGVLASARARGVVIELLPDLPSGPLLTVTVSDSLAQVVRDATTGAATPTATPATVTAVWNEIDIDPITIGGEIDLTEITDQLTTAVNDLISQLAAQSSPLNCSDSNPLADLICLVPATGLTLDAAQSAAEGFDFGPGTVGALATALHLELVRAASEDGGVILDLATAVAAANATPVQAPTTTTAAPEQPGAPRLARTGGSGVSPVLLLGLAGLAVLGTVATRRAAASR